jgi:hypothetical protein
MQSMSKGAESPLNVSLPEGRKKGQKYPVG